MAGRRPPSLLSRAVKSIVLYLFRRHRWTLEGHAPINPRCVIIGAPHTSNRDFVFFLGTTHAFGLEPRFMGKSSLFRWPMRHFMFDMGGVPVERSAKGNYAEAMIAAFAANDKFALVIAPEGTRSAVPKWRTGFYHIALGAGVPIVCGWLNHKTRRGGLGPEMIPSGDIAADMAKIAAFYREVMPGHPKWAAFDAMAGV